MQRRNQAEPAMLPASKYPRLIECAGPMTACDSELHYQFGIGAVHRRRQGRRPGYRGHP